jgi:DNA-binding HxlR family transcriptional regulator
LQSVANKTDKINALFTEEKLRKMLEASDLRTTVVRALAESPHSFLELLDSTRTTRHQLTQALESLIADGSVAKSSDGFQTFYSIRRTSNGNSSH